MPMTRRIRAQGQGRSGYVTANAEVLFMPGGVVYGWGQRFSEAVEKGVSSAAPTNKRPRWSHYGKPLKNTISAETPRFRKLPGRDAQRIYLSVGSTAKHSSYVDQGTGIYAGRGTYQGKILPPWERQSPTLYEASWVPPTRVEGDDQGPRFREDPLGTVTIKGQKGQFYFDKGLRRGFRAMRVASVDVPGGPKISDVLRSWPSDMGNFIGNTEADASFIADLKEWRAWRDRAFSRGRLLGQGYVRERERREFRNVVSTINKAKRRQKALDTRRAKNTARVAAWRAKQAKINKAKSRKKTPKVGEFPNVAAKNAAAIAAFIKQNPNVKILGRSSGAVGIDVEVGGRSTTITWAMLYGLL